MGWQAVNRFWLSHVTLLIHFFPKLLPGFTAGLYERSDT